MPYAFGRVLCQTSKLCSCYSNRVNPRNLQRMPAGPSRLRQCESFHYDNPRLFVIRKVSLAAACKPCSAVFSHMQWLRHSRFLFNVGRTSRFQQVPTFLVDVCSRADSVFLFWKPSCRAPVRLHGSTVIWLRPSPDVGEDLSH